MVPDIITPAEPDGIPKEYIYEAPTSVEATLVDIEFTTGDGLKEIENIKYKTTITQDGSYSISYTTRAEVTLKYNTTSEDITKTLKSVKWKYNIDSCILYKTNEWDAKDSLKVVNEANWQAKVEAILAVNQSLIRSIKHDICNKQMTIDEAKKLFVVKAIAQTIVDAQERELKNVRVQEIKNQITDGKGSAPDVPDEVIVAFAEVIIESVTGGSLSELKPLKAPYDVTTISSSFVEDIAEAIKGGIISINKSVSVNGKSYHLSGFSFSFAGQGVAGCTVNSKGTLTWALEKTASQEALARFCNTLAQLNTDSWKEFTSSYVTDFFNILNGAPRGDINIKKRVDKVFDKSETFLKALVTNDDSEIKELLCKSVGEEFYKKVRGGLFGWGLGAKTIDGLEDFVKNLIPDGKKLISYAKRYQELLEDISKLEKALNEEDQLKYTNQVIALLNDLLKSVKNAPI